MSKDINPEVIDMLALLLVANVVAGEVVVAQVVEEYLDGAVVVAMSTGHRIQYGYGTGGDGFCYKCQSFDCIDQLSPQEQAAAAAAPPDQALEAEWERAKRSYRGEEPKVCNRWHFRLPGFMHPVPDTPTAELPF